MNKKWWMESIGYQIYAKSFFDANNDGHGDLLGIYEKLPYLKSLGIDLIWICPFYVSPMDDNGYDVADFFDVSKAFGTLDDFKKLLKKAKEMNIKIILDLVLNHTSDEHPWFLESRKSNDNDYRDYYIWQKGKSNGQPPNNWGSFFGGSAWQYDDLTDEYYMKIFSNKMPDLNWKNEKVQDEMINIAKYWLDMGVDGFRIDAVAHLARAPFNEDALPKTEKVVLDWFKFSNLSEVHTYLKKMYDHVFKPYDALTIGEVGGEANIEAAYAYAGFNSNELNMVFNFDHNWCNNLFDITKIEDLKTDVKRLKEVFNKWQIAFKDKGWLPLNWLNHDQPRLMSHYGSKDYPLASGKMLATALYLMRGTPFVFQGEEIGMTNYPFKSLADFNDVSSINFYHEQKAKGLKEAEILFKLQGNSRDNPRSTMQWSDEIYGGFSKKKPQMNVNPNYKTINVKEQIENKQSLWYHYKSIFGLRKNPMYQNVFIYGGYEQIVTPDTLYVYRRFDDTHHIYVICSFAKDNVSYPLAFSIETILLNNYQTVNIENKTIILQPYQALVVVVQKEQS